MCSLEVNYKIQGRPELWDQNCGMSYTHYYCGLPDSQDTHSRCATADTVVNMLLWCLHCL